MSRPTQASFARLEEIVGPAHCVTDPVELRARQADGLTPTVVVRPSEISEVCEVLRYAATEKLAVIPSGGCTKLGVGSPPTRYDIALDLSRMNRVLAYDPHDLTLGVEPGMRISDLLQTLAEQKQFLPLTVPFSERATVGGVVASNSSSPLRHAYGSIKDFCLGMEFVTGEGVASKSGGRVVKNVTGFDLHKLLIGSLGTLAVITRVNFRTFPEPPAQKTFLATFADAAGAFAFCRRISESVLTPQLVEVADPGAAELLFTGEAAVHFEPRQWAVLITAAGQPSVVERYARELANIATAANANSMVAVGEGASEHVLVRLSEFPRLVLEAVPTAAIFRIGVLPASMASLLAQVCTIAERNGFKAATLTRASGILWAVLIPQEGSASNNVSLAKAVREVFEVCNVPGANASAMLEWCPTEVKNAIGGVWEPQRQDFPLMQRIKTVFDPQGILSPGRFAGGI